MTNFVSTTSITAAVSFLIALVSAGIAFWSSRRTDRNTTEIQSLKGAIDRDLERLRAKLAHGQIVSGTQWNVEFAAYQAIWKSIVDVRPVADKLVNREIDLHQIGLPEDYLNNESRFVHRHELTKQLVVAAKNFLSAVHDNAPFYPASIRDAANEAHKITIRLVMKNLSAITETMKSNDIVQTQTFYLESVELLVQLITEIDKVESLIRERLEAVQVRNPIVV